MSDDKIRLIMLQIFNLNRGLFGDIDDKMLDRILFIMERAYNKGLINMSMAILEMQKESFDLKKAKREQRENETGA